ncbi:hypothetical protein WICMUC_000777 [Wickerhamomyces mucosus]|uniref:RecA family profile 1 domain-containing protein n=1 Tax=Wickerhamomyces mucosus TaxID=1378264 RepID=A0A9P8PYR2_9ASCO|nr:hypothetical protein WICMUC_000777 [Wickerhamomyces mucosus]
MDLYQQFPHSSLNFDDNFQHLLEILKTFKISILDLLTNSIEDIFNKIQGKISILQLKIFLNLLKDETIKSIKDKSSTSTSLLSTGDFKLDQHLNGGYNGLIEIFGQSSTGKSQLCFQLIKQISNIGLKCVYIATEGGNFQSNRLISMGVNLSNIYFINCMDLESQEHIINYQLPNLLGKDNDIKLVIIDSISHHIRVELNPNYNDQNQRKKNSYYNQFLKFQKYSMELSHKLLNYIEDYKISIVLTNQISSKNLKPIINSNLYRLNFDYQLGWLIGWNHSKIKSIQSNQLTNELVNIPTMGLNFWNNFNIRICLAKNYSPNELHNYENNGNNEEFWNMERILKICYNSNGYYDDQQLEFKIDENGISII